MDYKLLIDKAKQYGFTDIEIYEHVTKSLHISIYNHVVDKNEISDVKGISIRAIYNGKMAYLSIENTEEDIEFILSNLKQNAEALTTDEEFEIFAGSKEYPTVKVEENDFHNYLHTDRIDMLMSLEEKVKEADARIVFVPHCHYQEIETSVRIINSNGLDVEKHNQFCAVTLQAVARENDDSQSAFEIEVKKRIKDLDLEKMAKEVVRKTVSMLNAKPVASKKYPVVIENKTMSSLFAAFQSIFSGEAAIKKITPLLGKENTKIMSDKISIIDDPLKDEAIFKHPFDDEGVACYRKEVVSNGVFKTLLHNLKTAKYFNTKSTGNGFKSGSVIGVSGSNIYIAPGNKTKEELISSIDEGLLITSLEGLHAGVNPISGDFSLKSSGYLIKNGKIDRAVTLIVISGNFFKLLNNVAEVGSDLNLRYTGIGAPSIKFNEVSISGE
ncbi:MAG TPA: TldD/PmbA family protein [Acholeplasmataceae bacterium]|nr:TldD/PmbA family protein [Acholeplasmataceae bacterium]